VTGFLKARWENVLLVTYAVNERRVRDLLPGALELDRWEDSAHISIVSVEFTGMRLWGIPLPFGRFPALNFRTYVRHGERPGVLFLRELVPHGPVAAVARALYGEPFSTLAQQRTTMIDGSRTILTHQLGEDGRQTLRAVGAAPQPAPPGGTAAHYFLERRWGFNARRGSTIHQFRVERKPWRVHPVVASQVSLDFGALYGPDWSFLSRAEPTSVILAEGSEVTIGPRESID
jgi:uncharacterized protein